MSSIESHLTDRSIKSEDNVHVFIYKKPVKGHSTESFLILL